ncbi:MAG TPA: hypothetical protein VGP94_06050 [Tepidisphaeraceae bacterium]|jgi:hypothetical protein|nr:hypothetical protein [Tepidisphaeraceae bacterium]
MSNTKKLITALCITLSLVFTSIAYSQEARSKDPAADTYEQLATAIIAIRKTEDGLVKGIILHAQGSAAAALAHAASATGAEQKKALETAATEITNAANEGDKPVLAVRQRLSKAGHTHHTDAETKEDYLWIDSKEKKQLLDLARHVSQLNDAAAIRKASLDLEMIMDKALQPE